MEEITLRAGSDNLSYVLINENVSALVDPGFDASEALILIDEKMLILEYVILTHHHSDHTSSLKDVVKETGCEVVGSEYCLEKLGQKGTVIEDEDLLYLGNCELRFLSTPGHTPGSICVVADGRYLITGDTLFIGDCGRCDLAGGSLTQMFNSLQKIKSLPDDMMILPGHDYGSRMTDSLKEQKLNNPTLRAKNLREFSGI